MSNPGLILKVNRPGGFPVPPGPPSPVAFGLFYPGEDQTTILNLASSNSIQAPVITDVYAASPDYTSLSGLPANGPMRTTFACGAVTAAQATTLGNMLVANGRANAIIRIMWEMNGNWFPWGEGGSLGLTAAEYVSTFQTAATAFRAVSGNSFIICWNINATSSIPTSRYPGSTYVDQIGVDVYEGTFNSLSNAEAYFTDALDYAKSESKLLCVPEWGVGGNDTDGPSWIDYMANQFSTNSPYMSWQCYFANASNNIFSGSYPNSLAAFKAAFPS